MIYAGIGSRETPDCILNDMFEISKLLSRANIILRSGGALGADTAFEKGAGKNKEIFLPFNGFNHRFIDGKNFFTFTPQATELAEKIHPNWKACKGFARQAHSRNCHIILGKNLHEPVDFILAYTNNGKFIGGTGLALALGQDRDIPIFNYGIMSPDVIREKVFELYERKMNNE